MTQYKIPHYVNPQSINSKYASAIARMTDYVWYLMSHRNYIVGLTFIFKDEGGGERMCGGEILKRNFEGSDKNLGEVVENCRSYVECNVKDDNLKTILVCGGNGEDRYGAPVYQIEIDEL